MKKMWGWFQFVLIVTIVTAGILVPSMKLQYQRLLK